MIEACLANSLLEGSFVEIFQEDGLNVIEVRLDYIQNILVVDCLSLLVLAFRMINFYRRHIEDQLLSCLFKQIRALQVPAFVVWRMGNFTIDSFIIDSNCTPFLLHGVFDSL